MALNLYRRHHRTKGRCIGAHKPDSQSSESDERARRWKQCHCPIYVCGTLGGTFNRKNTKRITWEEARAVAVARESLDTWAATPAVPQPIEQKAEAGALAVTIQFALDAYLASRVGRQIADSTLRKYKTFAKQSREFAEHKGYANLHQFTVPDMDEFYGSWKDAAKSKAKKLERLNGFLNFCVKRKWISENPASDLEAPVGSSTPASKMPLTDAELTRVYEACDRLPAVRWSNGSQSGEWTGEDVKTLIMLLAWTGLRISDGATFSMSRVSRNPSDGADVLLRMKKTDKLKSEPLFTWIADWLYDRLLAREKVYGQEIFMIGESRRLETVTEMWRRKLNRVFDIAGPFECGRPTPHIFRHTFVRLLLQRGVPVPDVAELIGDTEQVVRRHYARWVPERQERLTNILREKLATAPRPKLAVVGGKSAGRMDTISGR